MLEYDNNGAHVSANANTEGGKINSKIGPPEDALNVLQRLVENPRNEVWLLSGLRVKGVLERIAERLPGMGIVCVFVWVFVLFLINVFSFGMSRAENGCFIKTIKTRSSTSPHGDWINMVANFNLTWKSACLEMLNYVRSFLFLPFRSTTLTTPPVVVHRTYSGFICRRARGIHGLAVLDRSSRR